MKKKILAIGNYQDAIYHNFTGVDKRLANILSEYEIICTDQTSRLLSLKQDEISCIISYLDIWNSKLSDAESASFEQFIKNGGSALLLHNGISVQSQDQLLKLVGGKFLGHPEHETICFTPTSHTITKGCSFFSVDEEPYQIEMVPDNKEIILTYQYHDHEYPAGWCKAIENGRLIYLCPGHTPEIFDCLEYQKLIRQSVDWLMDQ